MANKKKKKVSRHPKKKELPDIEPAEYDYHLPVMLEETLGYLLQDLNGIYVDGTLGGGGHTGEILNRLGETGQIIAFDKDEQAIAHCREKFRGELHHGSASRLKLHHSSFEKACGIEEIQGRTNGILLDLGLSSRQLDESRRGFSFRINSPLDMRFGAEGKSAEEILNHASEEDLERILRVYGEEPYARLIARRITQQRRAFPLKTTYHLRGAVEETVPEKLRFKSLARVFQAVRIAVNSELEVLENTLKNSVRILAPGGRIVVMSYHSLEDRIVKTIFREFAKPKIKELPNDNTIQAKPVPVLKIITPKPILPTDEELARNPRSRSAKTRVAERL